MPLTLAHVTALFMALQLTAQQPAPKLSAAELRKRLDTYAACGTNLRSVNAGFAPYLRHMTTPAGAAVMPVVSAVVIDYGPGIAAAQLDSFLVRAGAGTFWDLSDCSRLATLNDVELRSQQGVRQTARLSLDLRTGVLTMTYSSGPQQGSSKTVTLTRIADGHFADEAKSFVLILRQAHLILGG